MKSDNGKRTERTGQIAPRRVPASPLILAVQCIITRPRMITVVVMWVTTEMVALTTETVGLTVGYNTRTILPDPDPSRARTSTWAGPGHQATVVTAARIATSCLRGPAVWSRAQWPRVWTCVCAPPIIPGPARRLHRTGTALCR